jgi:serine/threonine-protein kinase
MLLGTPAFMAPEQALAKSNEMDGQTDVWAVGATLFTLLSGQLVHEGDNASQLMIKTATAPARSLALVAPDMPAAVVALVDRALAFEKSGRWASALAMRDAVAETYLATFGEAISRAPLLALLQGGSAGSTPPERVPATTPSPVIIRATPSPGQPAANRGTPASFAQTTPSPRAYGGTMHLPATPPLVVAPPRVHAPDPSAGLSTSKPVSNDLSSASASSAASRPGPSRSGASGPAPSKGRSILLPVIAGISIGVIVGGFVLWKGWNRNASLTASAVSLNATPPAASTGPFPSAAPPPSSVPAPPTTPLPTATAAPPPQAAAPHAPAPAATNKAPHAAPPAKHAAAPNCNPNYVLDANGEQHFKPECFH